MSPITLGSGVTRRGLLLRELLAGHELAGVRETEMHRLCADLAAMEPRRWLRAIPTRGGGFRCALSGPAAAGEAKHVREGGR